MPPEVSREVPPEVPHTSDPDLIRFHQRSLYIGPVAPEVPHRFLPKESPRSRLEKQSVFRTLVRPPERKDRCGGKTIRGTSL